MKALKSKPEDGPYVFALKDSYREFSITLTDVLKCVLKAEDEGLLPGIPADKKIKLREMAEYVGDEL